MRLRRRSGLAALIMLALASLSVLSISTAGAQDTITLTVAMPELYRNLAGETLFDGFEAAHPGVTVNVQYTGFGGLFVTPAAVDIEEHLDGVAEYVSSADVLSVSADNISVEATRAGYYLDLTPLTSADATLNVSDFIPSAWQSFQADGGVWALPTSVDATMMLYNPADFDLAGLSYPNENWTLEDYAAAATALTQYDDSGAVTQAGLVTFGNTALLLRSLLGYGFYDSTTFPQVPSLDDPQLEALMTRWAELEAEGVVASQFSGEVNAAPMRILSSFGLGGRDPLPGNAGEQSAAALLPGGTAGLSANGFAVSGGTPYPDLAYELAKYLTNQPQMTAGPFGVIAARYSLAGASATQGQGGPGGGFFIGGGLSPENRSLVEQTVTVALPMSELRFADYVAEALSRMTSEGLDAHTALQEVEAEANSNLQVAAERGETSVVIVTTPPPAAALQAGEVALDFGLASFINPLPNQEGWDALVAEFVANDPQVGQVNLQTGFGQPVELSETMDCYYLPYNAVPGLDPETVLSLDPFLDVDASFDRNDVVGNALSLVQKDNKTWALPVVIQPQVLWYHAQKFAQAGVPEPTNGWTIDQFADALRTLKDVGGEDTPFVPRDPGGTYLLMLIAAYGGLPFDYRSDPATINFTDPATVEAIRQVLDLAKGGYLDYQEVGRGGGAFVIAINSEQDEDAIYSEPLNGIRFIVEQGGGENPYRMAMYPSGSVYNVTSYSIGTAYISATTENAEACYRWISTVAQHPELISGMPARRSLLSDPAYTASQSADALAFYQQMDGLLSDPNTINFESIFAGAGASPADRLMQYWLNRAFDRYVTEDADLDAELAEAQTFTLAFMECAANIPAFDPGAGEPGAFFQQYNECATSVDGTANLFG